MVAAGKTLGIWRKRWLWYRIDTEHVALTAYKKQFSVSASAFADNTIEELQLNLYIGKNLPRRTFALSVDFLSADTGGLRVISGESGEDQNADGESGGDSISNSPQGEFYLKLSGGGGGGGERSNVA